MDKNNILIEFRIKINFPDYLNLIDTKKIYFLNRILFIWKQNIFFYLYLKPFNSFENNIYSILNNLHYFII